VAGKAVFDLLDNKTFLTEWEALYQSCPWATPYQSKEYVGTWYRLYSEQYLPIIITAQEKGTLKGLLTLAWPAKKAKGKKRFVVAAGHHDSDYQVWLAPEGEDGAFVKEAFRELWKHYPDSELMLKYLPALTPLDWIQTDWFWSQHCALQPFALPVMEMKSVQLLGRKKKRLNRINKLARFECVTDPEEFHSLLNTQLVHLFDFRQGAMFNKNPFRNDPANKKLLLSLFAAGLLHVTVMKVNEEVIAAVGATIGKNRAYIGGINCHSPLYSDYSPGYFHFLLLARQLAQEGFDSFDLTPGYDFYKERLATRHERVHQLVVTRNRFYFVKRQVRSWFHHKMVQARVRPMSVELEMRKGFYLLRHRGLAACLAGWLKNHLPKGKPILYSAGTRPFTPNMSLPLQRDNFGDLLEFDQQGEKLTRWEFLAAALRRFEQGKHCYTWAEDSRLLSCIWVNEAKPVAHDGDGTDAEQDVWLSDLYCHAIGRERLDSFLRTVTDAVAGCTSKAVHALAGNAFMRRAFEEAGFRRLIENKIPTEKTIMPEAIQKFDWKQLKTK
jgi:hypothetical protein